MTDAGGDEFEVRGERRAGRLHKRREQGQMLRHGASIGRIYQNAISKRLSNKLTKKKRKKR